MAIVSNDELKGILTKSGYLTKTEIDKAFKKAGESTRDMVDVLLSDELITEEILTEQLAEYFKVPYLDLKKGMITAASLSMISEEIARKYQALPLEKSEGRLKIVMTDPSNFDAVKALEEYFKAPLDIYMVTKKAMKNALALYKTDFDAKFGKIIEDNIEKAKVAGRPLEDAAKDVPVVKILNAVFDYAAAQNSSDIHFEPEEDRLLIRFRVDGILRDIVSLPMAMNLPIVSRVKILADLKIDEHRLPQEGRFNFKTEDQVFSMRVSVIPTHYGERVEMRLLLEDTRPFTLAELGFAERDIDLLVEEAHRPYGMILVTGPTGSGKTTSLYSLLQLLNDPKVNIVTVEDPIEYAIPRISQMQTNEEIGLTFAEGLKGMMRQDPNIIMIGEIRDQETANTAVNAALTGHLLLSTLHTTDAAGAIPRLIDLGVEPFLLASVLRAVVAQRLVRKVCPQCVKLTKLSATPAMVKLIREMAIDYEVPLSLLPREVYQPTECPECPDGYKGRSGLFEVLRVTPKISDLIIKRVPGPEIKREARAEGMTTMLEDGLRKMQQGITTLEEVLRVIKE